MSVTRLLSGVNLGVSNYTVCTSGTRPGSPTEGMLIYETDTDLFYYYTGASWQLRGSGITTAATHPAAPIEGTLVFDTDTDALMVFDGAAWVEVTGHGAWKAYTPTWSGTLGNGTLTGTWRRRGRTIDWTAHIVWGTTTTHPASLQTLTLPVAPALATAPATVGFCQSTDTGVGHWFGVAQTAGGTTFNLSYNSPVLYVSNTAPMTWGSTDVQHCWGTYEAAS